MANLWIKSDKLELKEGAVQVSKNLEKFATRWKMFFSLTGNKYENEKDLSCFKKNLHAGSKNCERKQIIWTQILNENFAPKQLIENQEKKYIIFQIIFFAKQKEWNLLLDKIWKQEVLKFVEN